MKNVNLQTFVPRGAPQTTRCNGGVRIDLPGGQWQHTVAFPLEPYLPRRMERGIVVRVNVAVQTGNVAFGLNNTALSRPLSEELPARAGDEKHVALLAELKPDNLDGSPVLVVRNSSDQPVSLVVRQISVGETIDLSPLELKRARAQQYAYWHYSFDLGDGVVVNTTHPDLMARHRLKHQIIDGLIDEFLKPGEIQTALDLACASGFHAIEMAKRGWKVKGIDIDAAQIEQAKFVKSCIANDLDLTYEVADLMAYRSEPYDFVHCSGLFYHLEDPVAGARKLFDLCRSGAVVQSAVASLEGYYMVWGDHTKYSFCNDYEFSFVPTGPMLVKIFKHVGFSNVHSFSTLDRVPESSLAGLNPVLDRVLRTQNVYLVLKR